MQGLLKLAVRGLVRPALSGRVPVGMQRVWGGLIGLTLLGPRGATYHERRQAGVSLLEITPATREDGRGVLYLHGGGYVMGGFASHCKLAAAIGDAAGARVWLPDYRLAPEDPHPAALKDVVAIYSDLLQQGQAADQLVIAGDSAGGGLSLALALAIRDAGLPPPAALVLISPWTDLSLSGPSIASHAGRDPMLTPGWLRACSAAYRDGVSSADPACSPLFADLHGLPPTLIQVGSEEILLSDALRLRDRLHNAGADCELQQFAGLWHVFQLHHGLLSGANRAVEDIGTFIRNKTMRLAQAA